MSTTSDNSQAFTIRPFVAGDEHAINRSFAEAFGWERSIDEWRWKFRPEDHGCSISLAVTKEGEVVAHYGSIDYRAQVDGRCVMSGQVVDAFCLRRKQTVSSRLFEKTTLDLLDRNTQDKRNAFLYGFPSERHIRLGALRLTYNNRRYPIDLWTRSTTTRRIICYPFRIRTLHDVDGLDELWARAAHRYPVSIIRDATWFKRRYLAHPVRDYTLLSCERSGRIEAVAVLHVDTDVTNWVDLVWDGEHTRALKVLDAGVARLAQVNGTPSQAMWLAGDQRAGGLMEQAGWSHQIHPTGIFAGVRTYVDGLDERDVCERFYITMGCSDLI